MLVFCFCFVSITLTVILKVVKHAHKLISAKNRDVVNPLRMLELSLDTTPFHCKKKQKNLV